MSRTESKKYVVEEYHRKEWVPITFKDQDGNKQEKTVLIPEERAKRLNKDSKETNIRYTLAKNSKSAKDEGKKTDGPSKTEAAEKGSQANKK